MSWLAGSGVFIRVEGKLLWPSRGWVLHLCYRLFNGRFLLWQPQLMWLHSLLLGHSQVKLTVLFLEKYSLEMINCQDFWNVSKQRVPSHLNLTWNIHWNKMWDIAPVTSIHSYWHCLYSLTYLNFEELVDMHYVWVYKGHKAPSGVRLWKTHRDNEVMWWQIMLIVRGVKLQSPV